MVDCMDAVCQRRQSLVVFKRDVQMCIICLFPVWAAMFAISGCPSLLQSFEETFLELVRPKVYHIYGTRRPRLYELQNCYADGACYQLPRSAIKAYKVGYCTRAGHIVPAESGGPTTCSIQFG